MPAGRSAVSHRYSAVISATKAFQRARSGSGGPAQFADGFQVVTFAAKRLTPRGVIRVLLGMLGKGIDVIHFEDSSLAARRAAVPIAVEHRGPGPLPLAPVQCAVMATHVDSRVTVRQ